MTPKKQTSTQTSEKKQSTHKRNTSGLIPFKKGADPRRNMAGPNVKGFDDIRKLFQGKGNEEIEVTINGRKQKITRFEAIALALSSDKKHMRDFLEYAVGKVPMAVDVTNSDGSLSLPPEQIAQRVASLLEIAKKRKDNAG